LSLYDAYIYLVFQKMVRQLRAVCIWLVRANKTSGNSVQHPSRVTRVFVASQYA